MPSKAEIEKRIATFGDPKSNGAWAAHVARNKRYEAEQEAAKAKIKKDIRFGVENSNVSVSKAPQGSKQHTLEVSKHIDILSNNINGKKFNRKEPVALKFASPKQVGQLAERLETSRQMTGEESTWNSMKRTAKTPAEKKEIRNIIWEDYKKNGAANMDPDDLKWIGKAKSQQPIMDFKLDVDGISSSINNYVNAKRANEPVAPSKKEIDPDLSKGLGYLIGEPNGY